MPGGRAPAPQAKKRELAAISGLGNETPDLQPRPQSHPDRPARDAAAGFAAAFGLVLIGALVAASGAGCERSGPPERSATPASAHTPAAARTPRQRAAAATIRFANADVEPGADELGYDHLRVAAVFADATREDANLLGDLVGQNPRVREVPGLDQCVRQPSPRHLAQQRGSTPRGYVQLLDVGNIRLRAGTEDIAVKVQMVPSLFSAVRGVRYDVDIDHARHLLAAGRLRLEATGGDGVAPFEAIVDVPRPVRITHVGAAPVRRGRAKLLESDIDLPVRWGSVDHTAALELEVGAEAAGGQDWVRCRLTDDGAFTIPAVLLESLPQRTAEQPWLLALYRSRSATIPGFAGEPLRLELVDTVRVR